MVASLKMIVRPDPEIIDPLSEKLSGGRIAVKIFYKELKPSAERLKLIQLYSGSCRYIRVPVVLFVIFDIHRSNGP